MTNIRLITLPNLVTLLNLLCGCLAVVCTLRGRVDFAFLLMLASALFDFLDGLVARLTGQSSPIGVQLDSLADMVSFGLSPALIAGMLYYETGGAGAWGAAALLIAACSALRLAQFNIDDRQHDGFIGLPTPANALFFGALGWMYVRDGIVLSPAFLVLASVVMALLLVSPVRMFALKFRGWGWHGNQIRFLFLFAALVSVILFGAAGVALSVTIYLLVSLLGAIVGRLLSLRNR